MIFLRASLIPVFLLALSTRAWCGPLTLQECLEKAKSHNPYLTSVAWDTRIARENVRQANAGFLPRIDAQAGYTLQLEPQAVIISGRTAETQEPDFAFAGLSASYTLYDFGRRAGKIRQSTAIAEATARNFDSQRTDVSLQVVEAYFAILESNRLVTAATDETTQVEEHLRVAQALFEEGVVTRNDVLQAEVRLAAARQKVLSLRNRRENIWLRLNFLTGSAAAFRADLDDTEMTSAPEQPQLPASPSLAHRNDIQALRHLVDAGDAEVQASKADFLPELYTRLALDYVQNNKVREQAIMSATLGLKINLFDGYASTAIRERALHNRSKSMDALRLAEEQARLEIDTAGNDVAVAGERISVAQAAIRQSEENLRINKERYQERVGTATDVLDAQTLVTQARTDYYRAYYDRQVALARLKKALGEL